MTQKFKLIVVKAESIMREEDPEWVVCPDFAQWDMVRENIALRVLEALNKAKADVARWDADEAETDRIISEMWLEELK